MLKNILLASAVALGGITGARADSYSVTTQVDSSFRVPYDAGAAFLPSAPTFDATKGSLTGVQINFAGTDSFAISPAGQGRAWILPENGVAAVGYASISGGGLWAVPVQQIGPLTNIHYHLIADDGGHQLADSFSGFFGVNYSSSVTGAGALSYWLPGAPPDPQSDRMMVLGEWASDPTSQSQIHYSLPVWQTGYGYFSDADITESDLVRGIFTTTFLYTPPDPYCTDHGNCKDHGQHIPEAPSLPILAIGLLGLAGVAAWKHFT